MGQCHYLVNLDKKQVIHPCHIGNGQELKAQIGWDHSTATVLVMLLAASSKDDGRGDGDFTSNHPLVGAWAGDRIAFVGNYAAAEDISGFDSPMIYEQCKAACSPDVKDDEPPGWREWTNISGQVREMMAAEFGVRYTGRLWLDIVEKKTKRPPASSRDTCSRSQLP